MKDLVFIPIEKPPCPEYKGTRKIVLFTGIVDCEACKPKPDDLVIMWDDPKGNIHVKMIGRGTSAPNAPLSASRS